MSSTQLRDKASRLAKTDATAALTMAREIPDPWFRAQALAAAARWIDDQRVKATARESLAAANSCDDDYKRAAVSAWPIRALLERGFERPAREALRQARSRALAAKPAGSQAEALFALLQGSWSLGLSSQLQLIGDLTALQESSSHWRADRALVNALGLLGSTNADAAREIAERIKDDKCRSRALVAIQRKGACAPRDYF